MHFVVPEHRIVGSAGELIIQADDEVTRRLMMILEAECEGLGAARAAAKYGLSRQRYYQLLGRFQEHGAMALQTQKPGPKSNYVRTDEVVRRIIRHRFLDSDASVDTIAQDLRQGGFIVSTRSVDRVIEEFGLQQRPGSLPH
jgi:transposase